MTNNVPARDATALNAAIIEAEDAVFSITRENAGEMAARIATKLDAITMEVMVWIMNERSELAIIKSSLGNLAEIHRMVAANASLMNNLVINTTLQGLKLAYCLSINEETQYLPALQKTSTVIRNLLRVVSGKEQYRIIPPIGDLLNNDQGEESSRSTPLIAEIIDHIPQSKSSGMDFFFDEPAPYSEPKKSLKILIVDDEVIHRTLMQKIVSPYGTCDIAVNGQAALTMFEEAHDNQLPYDMITLDINMPIMNGQQTLKMIRRRERERGILSDREVTIFMVSSMDGEHVLEAFFRGHCTDYIKKPYATETILGKMRSNHLIS